MAEKDISKIKTTIVNYEQFSDYEFIPPATYYVMDSLQQYVFVHTANRAEAQQVIDNIYGSGRYTAVAAKTQKTKSRLENGGCSAYGTATRKGQKK